MIFDSEVEGGEFGRIFEREVIGRRKSSVDLYDPPGP